MSYFRCNFTGVDAQTEADLQVIGGAPDWTDLADGVRDGRDRFSLNRVESCLSSLDWVQEKAVQDRKASQPAETPSHETSAVVTSRFLHFSWITSS